MTNIGIGMRDKNYQHLLASRVWKNLRVEYLSTHPLCEDCEAKGATRLATEVHHIIPISNETTYARMRALAYDRNNLRALCHDCHEAAHAESGARWDKATIRAKHTKRVALFAEQYLKTPPTTPGGV